MSDLELRQIFMDNLNYYLNLNDYTQADMARYMKVSTATAAKWCTGQTMPRVDKIQSLCNWFGIEKSDLLEKRTKEDGYYMRAETAALAQELFENHELRALFDAARDISPEDMRLIYDMALALKRKEGGHDDDGC